VVTEDTFLGRVSFFYVLKEEGKTMIKKILIADDEVNLLKLLKHFFRVRRYDVILATNGEEALNKAREEKPDLMILDIMMPKKDGFEVCKELKLDENYRNIPIIMLTAKGKITDKITGKEAGADMYLVKPVDFECLLANVETLLNKKAVSEFLW
jgi:two-component system alkaline phosphatase synthesis response regulator PhoP